MLIMHVIPGDMWAGAESQVYSTIRELSKKPDLEIIVVLFNEKELYKRLINENVIVYLIDENSNNGIIISYKIRSLLKKIRPHVLHVHEYKSHILTFIANLSAGSRSNIVRTLHGQTASPIGIKYIKTYTILHLENLLLRYLTDCIIAVSSDLEHLLKKKYKNTRICPINNAVQILPVNEINIEGTRSRLGIGVSTFWIGAVARLVNVKNLDMLIDVARILSDRKMCDFKISVFGEGPLEESLQQKINRYGLSNTVYLHGHCNNLLPILKSLDVFVLTSLNEGLPMSLLEAMSVGTTPVCTKVGGMQEVIEDKKCGFLINSGSAEKFAEAIISLRENRKLRAFLGSNALNRIQDKYSIEKNVNRLIELYTSLQ